VHRACFYLLRTAATSSPTATNGPPQPDPSQKVMTPTLQRGGPYSAPTATVEALSCTERPQSTTRPGDHAPQSEKYNG
jgi:hypothetical protein